MSLLAALTGIQVAVDLGQAALSFFTSDEKKQAAKKLVASLPDSSRELTTRIVNTVLSAKEGIPEKKSDPSPERPIVDFVRKDKDLYITFLEELLQKQKTTTVSEQSEMTIADQLAPAAALAEVAGTALASHDKGGDKLAAVLGKVAHDLVPVANAVVGGIHTALKQEKEETKDEDEPVDKVTEVLANFALGPQQKFTSSVKQRINAEPGHAVSAILETLPQANNKGIVCDIIATAEAMRRVGGSKGIIVDHCSASDSPSYGFKEIKRDHMAPGGLGTKKGASDIGYHLVIHRDGSFHKGREIKTVGAHAKGHNRHSIGLCVCGHYSYTKESMNALVDYTKSLMNVFGIPLENIYPHNHFDKNRDCSVYDVEDVKLAVKDPSWKYTKDVRFDKNYKCIERGLYHISAK